MSYYEDLSPYQLHPRINLHDRNGLQGVNVGWLDLIHPFDQGVVDSSVLAKIGILCLHPVNRTRGYHPCVCPEYPVVEIYGGSDKPMPLGDAEIRVQSVNKIYFCPTLIYHYILRHEYLPPQEFLDAVKRLID